MTLLADDVFQKADWPLSARNVPRPSSESRWRPWDQVPHRSRCKTARLILVMLLSILIYSSSWSMAHRCSVGFNNFSAGVSISSSFEVGEWYRLSRLGVLCHIVHGTWSFSSGQHHVLAILNCAGIPSIAIKFLTKLPYLGVKLSCVCLIFREIGRGHEYLTC